ncbi:MAG: hypothetical protein M0Z99_14075 [Betaproteobacteria bacterium]|nr:hypothetical protein [Betaproteobacteria bacterium]
MKGEMEMKYSIKTDTRGTASSSTVKRRSYWIAGALALGTALATGSALLAGGNVAHAGLPDLLGKAQPPLPKGALQVQDLAADPKGYTGSILVRGVVAKFAPNDPHLVGLIDSREARVCRDLNCAQYYLPIKVKDTNLKPWDEVNVRGTMTEDPARKTVYLRADSVESLGSIKK